MTTEDTAAKAIDIYLRCRPTFNATKCVSLDFEAGAADFNLDKVDKSHTTDFVNNTRTQYRFKFTGVFGMESKQDELFTILA